MGMLMGRTLPDLCHIRNGFLPIFSEGWQEQAEWEKLWKTPWLAAELHLLLGQLREKFLNNTWNYGRVLRKQISLHDQRTKGKWEEIKRCWSNHVLLQPSQKKVKVTCLFSVSGIYIDCWQDYNLAQMFKITAWNTFSTQRHYFSLFENLFSLYKQLLYSLLILKKPSILVTLLSANTQ